jgi:hypothetical protein
VNTLEIAANILVAAAIFLAGRNNAYAPFLDAIVLAFSVLGQLLMVSETSADACY